MEFFDGVKVNEVRDGIVVLSAGELLVSLFGSDWWNVSSEKIVSAMQGFANKHNAVYSSDEEYWKAFFSGIRQAKESNKKLVIVEVI